MSNYKIGYKNPPIHARFKKGQSGNPSGRRRKPASLLDIFDRLIHRKLSIREGDTVRSVSAGEALIMSAFNKAMKGHGPSLKLVQSLWNVVEDSSPEPEQFINDQTADDLIKEFIQREGKIKKRAAKRKKKRDG